MVKLTKRGHRHHTIGSHNPIIARMIRQRLKAVVNLSASVASKSKNPVEIIHRLRTETRRADAALRLFADWLPSQPATRVQRTLTDIRRKASSLRDFDVMMPIVESFNDLLPVEAMEFLRHRAKKMQKKRANSLRRFCGRMIERGFSRKVRSLIHRVGWRVAATIPEPHEVCLRSVEQLAVRFDRVVESLKCDEKQLHAVRILGRRIRYTLELIQKMSPALATRPVCDQLVLLQDSVGQANDKLSTFRFLRMCLDECQQQSFATDLERVVAAFEVTTNVQTRAVTQNTIEKAGEILASLGQLIQVDAIS